VRRQFIAALTAVTLAGCALREPPKPAPVTGLPAEASVLTRRIADSLRERRIRFRTLRSRAQLTYRAPGQSVQHAKHVIIAQRPDRLRFEVYSLLGSLFVLTARAGALTAYLPRESTVYRGAASRANLARYTHVDLSVSSAIDLLLGTPPLSGEGVTDVSADGGLLRYTQVDRAHSRSAWFDGDLQLQRYESVARSGDIDVRASFAEYQSVDGVAVATRLTLELPASGERIEIALRDPEVNPAVPDSLFTLVVPADSREVDLDRAL
jgi:outer membrane lipoprotein-sorting protein